MNILNTILLVFAIIYIIFLHNKINAQNKIIKSLQKQMGRRKNLRVP